MKELQEMKELHIAIVDDEKNSARFDADIDQTSDG